MSKRSRFAAVVVAVVAITSALCASAALARPFFGTKGDDVINGTRGHDIVVGRAGNDLLNGFARWDVVLAGDGNDTVNAGRGHDFVFGGPGDDTLNGGFGRDRIAAQTGADTINGGPGADDLWALIRTDVTGVPNEPADTVNGGPGPDRIHVRDGEADHVDCGGGHDVVLADTVDVIATNCESVERQAPAPTDETDDE